MKQKLQYVWSLTLATFLLLASNQALADRLTSAAERGKSELLGIGEIVAQIAIVLGGLLMALGASQIGRMVITGGIIGACAIFGGPALVETLRSIFGA